MVLSQALLISGVIVAAFANSFADNDVFPLNNRNDKNCNVKAFNYLSNYGGPSFISSYCFAIAPTNKRWTQTATATTVITVFLTMQTRETPWILADLMTRTSFAKTVTAITATRTVSASPTTTTVKRYVPQRHAPQNASSLRVPKVSYHRTDR